VTEAVHEQIEVAPGRVVDVSYSGAAEGPVLIFHHGTPGSCAPVRAFSRAAEAAGLRVVAFSRPGYGRSTRHPGRAVVDVVADTTAVLAAVGADHCLMSGWSGGGPHALACAARLPQVRATFVIAGVAPYDADGLDWLAGMGEDNVIEFGKAIEGKETLAAFLSEQGDQLRHIKPEEIAASMTSILPEVDKAVLTDEFAEDTAEEFHDGLSAGIDGWLDDDLAFVRSWGFDLDEIVSPVSLWQGSEDLMVPFAHGQWLAARVPGASVHLEDGEGHLSIGVGHLDRIMAEACRAGGFTRD
jgi:pimeloyl-ACP methyl ester carboxylesterase